MQTYLVSKKVYSVHFYIYNILNAGRSFSLGHFKSSLQAKKVGISALDLLNKQHKNRNKSDLKFRSKIKSM